MAVGYNPRAITDGLVLALDAGNPKNYNAGISTNWTDKVGGNNGTLVNGAHHNDGPFVGAGYVEFDGSGDYLTAPNSSAWNFDSGDLTIEAWVYIAGNSPQNNGGNRPAAIVNTWSNSFSGWLFIIKGDSSTTGTGLQFATWSSSNATRWNADLSISQQRWHHIAATVSGGTRQLFLNGTLLSGYTSTVGSGYTLANSLGNDLRIGRTTNTNNLLDLNGYISNLRIVKGTALYTSDFTPPTKPLTAVPNTVLLTCQGNTIADASSSAHSISVTGNAAANLGSPASAFVFDGTDDHVIVPSNNEFAFGTGDFTVECWFNSDDISITTQRGLFQTSDTAGGLKTTYTTGVLIAQSTSGEGSLRANVLGTYFGSTSGAITANKWYHVALTRASGVCRLFLDGSLLDSATISGSIDGTNLCVGGYYSTSFLLDGKISNFRIYKGKGLTAAEVTQNYNATKGRYA